MKKKKLKKRIIIAVVCVVLVAGIIVGVVIARQNTGLAYVRKVGELNSTAFSSGNSFTGRVVESAQMKVLADTEKKIDEIFVSEGDTVKKGDKLFQYDPTLLELTVEEKQLGVTNAERALSAAQQQLTAYQNIVPYTEPPTEAPTEPPVDSAPSEGETLAADDAATTEEEAAEPTEGERHYTASEKTDLVANQQVTVKKAQTAVDSAKEELNEAKKALEHATVVSQLDGVAAKVQDLSSLDTSSPVCVITGNTGVTVKLYIDEFHYTDLKIGDKLSVTSNISGAAAEAEVLTIGDYPVENQSGGSGNPNSSYYEVSAFLKENEGFEIGEDVTVSLVTETDQTDTIVLSKMYVRTDTNGSYVLKDSDGKLVRQPVSTKKASEGDYVIITDGLTEDDMIAFPYGSKGKVGKKTTTEDPGVSLL